MLVLETNILP